MRRSLPRLTPGAPEEKIESGTEPLLLAFLANWCPPCRSIRPVLEAVASELTGRLRVVEVDIDAHLDLARRHDVQVIPTLVALQAGRPVRRLTGYRTKDQLVRELAEVVSQGIAPGVDGVERR